MLKKTFEALDKWMRETNAGRRADGTLELRQAEIRVVGQAALLEMQLDLELLGTADVDAYVEAQYEVKTKFDALLQEYGERHLDPHSDEVWMPAETEYVMVYSGEFVHGLIAQPEYILLSKALKAPRKNEKLIVDYLAAGPTQKFMDLAGKYGLDLEQFV